MKGITVEIILAQDPVDQSWRGAFCAEVWIVRTGHGELPCTRSKQHATEQAAIEEQWQRCRDYLIDCWKSHGKKSAIRRFVTMFDDWAKGKTSQNYS